MVSKVAVIALVAIVACPILLGYALNLNEISITDYKSDNDSVNVTPLLQDGTGYSYAAANVADLNSRVNEGGSQAMPDYVSRSSTQTSIPVGGGPLATGNVPLSTQTLSDFKYTYYALDYVPSVGQVNITLTFNDNSTITKYRVHNLYWNENDPRFMLSCYTSTAPWSTESYVYNNVKSFVLSKTSGYNGDGVNYYYYKPHPEWSNYADLAAGYYLNSYNSTLSNPSSTLRTPSYTRNILLTMDLSTITASSYSFDLVNYYGNKLFRFEKTTDGSGVHWTVSWGVRGSGTAPNLITELYYDSSKSSNTYQIFLDLDSIDFRYVGSWPTVMGYANVYWNYEFGYTLSREDVYISFEGNKTPKMRIDAAEYRAFEYPIIENETYDPVQFRSNPITTISNTTVYGTSLTFGGNTYAVSKGNITLGTHQIPVDGLTLSSIPVSGGYYENRIGNTVISTTAAPSTITFNGKWSASVSTASMESYTYTKTEWTPGEFGWDGIDQNFLMVGLLTSIGVFIALGLYVRRSRSSLWPLLVVCGGAVVLFFIML